MKALYNILENPKEHKWGPSVQIFLFSIIFINIIALSLDTMQSLHTEYGGLFSVIEYITVSIFIVELLARYISIGVEARYSGLKGKFRFTFTFFTLVDIISILPFILSLFGIHSSFLRALRLLRIFKLFRTSSVLRINRIIKRIFQDEKEEFIIVFAFIGILLIVLTAFVYIAENSAQPENFSSIPQTLWWAIVTLTTIGYGDIYPVTAMGRIMTTVISVLGIAFYAVPGGLFTAALIKEIDEEDIDKMKNNRKID